MPKITDPDLLVRDTEISFSLDGAERRRLWLFEAGNLTGSEGVSFQTIYSKCKELWKTQSDLIRIPFPLISITEEKFDFINEWAFASSSGNTSDYVRDGGWSVKDVNNVSQEEWMGWKTLGTFANSQTTERAYYQQSGTLSPISAIYTGPVNQGVQMYQTESYDYRTYFKCFLRESGSTFDGSDLNAIGIATMSYQVYAFPLTNAADTKIQVGDTSASGEPPYNGITATYYTGSVTRSIGGSDYHFNVIINGNNASKEDIYTAIQYQLRQTTDIDQGTEFGYITGSTADELLEFIGDTLRTTQGVFIDSYQATDVNFLEFRDTGSTIRTFPFVAAGTLTFNNNLINDISGSWKMFFTSVPSGDFGTTAAVIVNDFDTNPLTGSTYLTSSVTFDFDYDNNEQGGRTSGSDANVTVVAIGFSAAQYVSATGTIQRSNANAISLVAALERNYLNP